MTSAKLTGEKQQSKKLSVLWRQRDLTGKILMIVAAMMVVYHLLYVSQVLARCGIYIMVGAHRGLSLCFMLVITFLTTRAKRGTKLAWYDIVLILMSVAGAGYYFVFFRQANYHLQQGVVTTTETILFWLLLVALLEAGRRLMGLTLPIIVLFFVFHALFTNYFPGVLSGRAFSMERLVQSFYLGTEGIFGIPFGTAATIVVVFVTFAELLRESGAADFFLNLAMSLFGTVKGGPAKIAVFGSALFATISGSPTANAAGIGAVTIPLMKSVGYKPHFAAAVEATAGKGGQITPPVMGAVAFLMAEMTGIGYLKVCIAAALPALLYFTAVFFQVHFEAVKTGMRGLSRDQIPSVAPTIKQGWLYLVPLLALVAFMFQLKYEAEMAAVYSILVLFVITVFRKESRLTGVRLISGFQSAARSICIAAIACALAGVIIGSLAGTGFGVSFSAQLVKLSGGNLLALLLLTAIACYILGMGISSTAIYVILATLVAPSLIKIGVPLEAAHLFVIYWGNVAFISPPVAVAVFVTASIAGCDPMRAGWQAVRLAIVSFVVPFMFVYDPVLIMIGPPANIALATVTSIIGVIMLAAGLEGYLWQPTNWVERLGLLAGGLLLIFPDWRADFLGIGMALAIVLYQLRAVRTASQRVLKTPIVNNEH